MLVVVIFVVHVGIVAESRNLPLQFGCCIADVEFLLGGGGGAKSFSCQTQRRLS